VANLDATQVKYPGCSGCVVHQGFYNAFSSVEGYVRKDLQALVALYRTAKIYVTGFSSGGSLATIAALDVKEIFARVDQLYTYGQSRVGN
jgi:predicted lipase